MPCGLAGGCFAWAKYLLKFFDASKGVPRVCPPGSNAHRDPHTCAVCLCSLPACVMRVQKTEIERNDAAAAAAALATRLVAALLGGDMATPRPAQRKQKSTCASVYYATCPSSKRVLRTRFDGTFAPVMTPVCV